MAALLLAPTRVAPAQSGGIAPEWEVRKLLESIVGQAQRLIPLLEEVKPAGWLKDGAPEAYVDQAKSARAEVDYVVWTTEALSEKPDRLTKALEAHFRLQRLDSMVTSLAGGVRRYQNPALADLMQAVLNDNVVNRDQLRQYVIDLAAIKEVEFEVADREAQRCRGILSRQPGREPRTVPK